MAIVHSVHPEAGVPKIDSQTCTRCGQCARICPSEVLELRNSTIVVKDSPFGCFACGHCMMVCPNGSITVKDEAFPQAIWLTCRLAARKLAPSRWRH